MTIYGTPGGTPLNQNGGFQGTQPGLAVGATLQNVQPGVGMLPPNSDSRSGDSVQAACSRAALPLNTAINNFGVARHQTGESIAASMSANGQGGAANLGGTFGGSANVVETGGSNPGGAANVNANVGQGDAQTELTADMAAAVITPGLNTPNVFMG